MCIKPVRRTLSREGIPSYENLETPMKKMLLASVALAMLVAFPFAAQATDPLDRPYRPSGSGTPGSCTEIRVESAPAGYVVVDVLLDIEGINMQGHTSGFYRFEVGMNPDDARRDGLNRVQGVFRCSYRPGVFTTEYRVGADIIELGVGGTKRQYFAASILLPANVVGNVRVVTQFNNVRYVGTWATRTNGTRHVVVLRKQTQ